MKIRESLGMLTATGAVISAVLALTVPARAELWEEITRENGTVTARQQVPEGWLVKTSYGEHFEVLFLRDPQHTWAPLRSSPLVPTPGRFVELHEPNGNPVQVNIMDIVLLKEDPSTEPGTTTKVTLRYSGEFTVRETAREIVNQLE